MGRIKRLESAFVQITELLVDHSERFDGLQRSVDGLQRSVDGVKGELEGVNGRLDRLIAVTIE